MISCRIDIMEKGELINKIDCCYNDLVSMLMSNRVIVKELIQNNDSVTITIKQLNVKEL